MLVQRPTNIGLAPTQPQGSRITNPLTLTSLFVANSLLYGSQVSFDLMMEDAEGVINNIQTLYVDASQTPSPFVLYFPESQQTIWIAAKTQGYYPFACGDQCQIQAKSFLPGGAGYSITVQFLNVPVPPCVWNTPAFGAGGLRRGMGWTAQNGGNAALAVSTFDSLQPSNTIPPGAYNGKYILACSGFAITGSGATAAGDVTATIGPFTAGFGGTVTLEYDVYVPVIGTGNVELNVTFPVPLYPAGGDGVAGQLAVTAEAGEREPDERVEPIDPANNLHEKLHDSIAPLHMGQLVRQDNTASIVAPLLCRSRQKYDVPQ